MWIITFISGLLTGFFGWCGGRGDDYWRKHPRWPRWLLRSWVRDWLIGPVVVATAYLLGVHSWWILLTIGLTGAALSTYWDFLFGFDNFWFHGFVIGIAGAPIAYVTGHWWMFALRCLILAVWMGVWSLAWKDADIEEGGRYVLVGSTVWLIC